MAAVTGKNIVIGVTASIAAFKVPALVRLFKKEGASVKIMMTPSARDFVTPLTLSTLSGQPVITQPFDPESGVWHSHVELGQWADIYLLAPITANTIAKLAHGIADNFYLTACLSAKCPIFFAPAMDLDMFKHEITQRNIAILQSLGYKLIEPAVGELASGLCGAGRMEEPDNIFKIVSDYFSHQEGPFRGKNVLVTAGPTHEAIDPVRFIGNKSSGLMGFALAEAFAREGANVTLVTGPVSISTNQRGIKRIDVVSASDMYNACIAAQPESDIIVMAAAVADFTPASPSHVKIKKSQPLSGISLLPTKDILAEMGNAKRPGQIIAGFALETDHEEENAREKLAHKNLDLIVLNSLKDEGAGFMHQTNKVSIMFKSGEIRQIPLKHKHDIAREIVHAIRTLI